MLIPLLAAAMVLSRPNTIYLESGEALVKMCKNVTDAGTKVSADEIDAGTCIGFVMGVVDGATFATHSHPDDFPACIPTAATRKELILVVVKYGEDHPEKLHRAAGFFVLSTYPCGQ
jgi:hypothetical protein